MSQFKSRSFSKEPLIFVNVNCHSVSSRYSFALVVYLQSIVNFKRHLDCGWIMVKIGSSFVIIDDKVKGFYILCCGGERSRRTAVLSRAVVALVGQTVPEDIEARGGLLRQFL